MDLLETMYSLKWLSGNFEGAYAYRSGVRVGFKLKQDENAWVATVIPNFYGDSASELEVKVFSTEEEATQYVETSWKKFVDDIMED